MPAKASSHRRFTRPSSFKLLSAVHLGPVNTPPPKGGGFRLRLEAGLIDPSGRFSQTTLKLSSGLYGAFFVKGASRHFGRPLHSILLFDPRREHSSVPTAYFHRRRGAAAVKDGASSAPPKACP